MEKVKRKGGGFGEEFKKFALKGSVIDLAVGVIIGGAFATITTSLVNDILLPVVGGVDFSKFTIMMQPIFKDAEPISLNIGNSIQAAISFVVLALVIFFIVKAINKAREAQERKKAEEKASEKPAPSNQELLLAEIRDILKGKGE